MVLAMANICWDFYEAIRRMDNPVRVGRLNQLILMKLSLSGIFRNKIQKPIKPVFIVGCGRSGTALLCNLLKDHPDLAVTGGYPDGEDHTGWVKYGRLIMAGLGDPRRNDGLTAYSHSLYMDESDVTPDVVKGM